MVLCKPDGEHVGQGLLLRLGGTEGDVVLTCHHVVASGKRDAVRVRLPRRDGELGEPVEVAYDDERSCPKKDLAVLRIQGVELPTSSPTPLLHELDADTYEGSLQATVLTCLKPDNFDATVRPSTEIDPRVDANMDWPETPERCSLRAFRLAHATDSKPGFSGGVVYCARGILGLAHFGRRETEDRAREDYMVPLSEWAEGWPALENMIEPLVDGKLMEAATVKRGCDLTVGLGEDVVLDRYRPGVYVRREADDLAHSALEERGGVIVVGRPLSGKSRLVAELFRGYPRAMVVIPRSDRPGPPEGFERSGFRGREVILLFDDLHYTARSSRPLAWIRTFEEATERRCKVVCTSRDGTAWTSFETEQQHLLDFLGRDDAMVFTSRVEGPRHAMGEDLSEEQGWELAQDLGIGAADFDRRFDRTPGSLLLDLGEMGKRYEALRDDHRSRVSMGRLLDSAKVLLRARHPGISQDLVRAVAERVRGSAPMDDETWETLIRRTREEGFAQLDEESESISYYTPYLERCVYYEPTPRDLHKLEVILTEREDGLGLFTLVGVYGEVLRDTERALSCAQKAAELDPDFAGVWYNLSYALNGVGRFEESLSAVERALNLDPEYNPAYYSKGFALNELMRYREAVEAFNEAIRLGQGAYEGIVSMYFNGLGGALANQGLFYGALSAAMQAIHLHPPYKPTARLLCSLLLGAKDLYPFALEACEFMLFQDPQWAEAWCAKGNVLYRMSRYKEALAAYKRAIGAQPQLVEAWYGKGVTLLAMSDSARGSEKLAKYLTEEGASEVVDDLASRSLEAFDRAITLDGGSPSLRSNKGSALSRLGRNQQALSAHDTALELDPGITQVLHNRGMVRLKMCHHDEALEDFEEAVRLDPDFAPAWFQVALLTSGHFDEQMVALFAVDQAIRIWPGDTASWFVKGCILSKLGRHDLGRLWLRCARSHKTLERWLLADGSDGIQRSFLDFLGPLEPRPDERYRGVGSPDKNPAQAMRARFERTLSPEQRDAVRALKLLVFAGTGEPTRRQLRAVLASASLFGREDVDLDDTLVSLARQAFVDLFPGEDRVRPEYACLWEMVYYRAGRRIEQDLDALAEVFAELGDHEGLSELSSTYSQAVKDYESALACADRAIALKPDYAPAWGNRSGALGNLERHAEALEAIEEAGRLSPGHPTASFNKAVALNQLERYADALAVFDAMEGFWSDNPDVLLGRSEAFFGLGRVEEGVAEVRRAGELRPYDADLALREGMKLSKGGDWEGAISAVDRALSVRPDDHSAYFLRATALMATERNDEAITWFLRAWSVRHRFPDDGAMIAEMLRGLGHNPEPEVP